MKKVVSVLLSAVMIFLFAGCGDSQKAKAWAVEDFSFYDSEKNEVEFPVDDSVSLRQLNEERGGDFQTYEGIKIGTRAEKLLEVYDLSQCYIALIMEDYSNLSDFDKEFEKAFLESHPTIKDVIDSQDELNKRAKPLGIFISLCFHQEGNSLVQYKTNELGNIAEDTSGHGTLYDITFRIYKEKIQDVYLESKL